MTLVYEGTGFNLQKYIEVITFNLISRFIGAFIRFFLLILGLIIFIFVLLLGFSLLPFFLLFPFFGVFTYSKYILRPDIYFVRILKNKDGNFLKELFQSQAGSFFLSHTGISSDDVLSSAKISRDLFLSLPKDSFESIIGFLVSQDVWSEDFFIRNKISKEDFIAVSSWWDEVKKEESGFFAKPSFPSGLALELLTGYTPQLDKYSSNLATPRILQAGL